MYPRPPRHARIVRYTAAAFALALTAAACAADEEPESGGRVFVIEPADGATVTSPVTITVEMEGIEPGPAGELVDGEGHMHVIVNADCLPIGQAIPGPDETYMHWGDGSVSKEVELPVGEHKLCIQAADGFHQAYDAIDVITVRVIG